MTRKKVYKVVNNKPFREILVILAVGAVGVLLLTALPVILDKMLFLFNTN